MFKRRTPLGLSTFYKYKEKNTGKLFLVMKIYEDMIVLDGQITNMGEGVIEKGNYLYKEYGKQGKLTYISKKDFKKRFRKVTGF